MGSRDVAGKFLRVGVIRTRAVEGWDMEQWVELSYESSWVIVNVKVVETLLVKIE